MDPITTAIIAGVANLAEPAIKDAYAALKGAIVKRFGPASEVAKAVDDVEQKPNSNGRQATLGEEVKTAKADEEAELISLAESLRKLADQSGGGGVHVRQDVRGDSNIFSGTGNVTVQQGKPHIKK